MFSFRMKNEKQTSLTWKSFPWISIVGLFIFTVAIIYILKIIFCLNASDTVKSILPLFTAFFGTYFAFKLNTWKEENKQSLEEKAALNTSLFTLIRQYNAVRNYLDNFPQSGSEVQRAVSLKLMKPPNHDDLIQDFASLNFLIETDKYAHVLLEITIEQERFHQAFEAIRLRNDYFDKVFLPETTKAQLYGKDITEKILREKIDNAMLNTAIEYTNNISYHLTESEKSLVHMIDSLRAVAKEIFPHEKFVYFETVKRD